MRRRKALLEQQAHRIAFVAEGRLHADHDVAEGGAEHEDRAAVAELLAGRRAPVRLDVGEPALAAHVVVGRDAREHVGIGAMTLGVAVQDGLAQGIDACRHLDAVAGALHAGQRVMQRFEHGQMRGRAGVAAIRREVEQHDGDLALGALGAAQGDQPVHAQRQRFRALDAALHVAGVAGRREHAASVAARALRARGIRATAEGDRARRAVQLRNRDHDRRLDGQQAALAGTPLLERLELERMRGDVGHVEPREHVLGRLRIVVGRSADEREACQRDDGIDRRTAVLDEELLDRRTRVETGGKGRHHVQATRFKCRDDTVVMRGIAGQRIRAQQQQADGAAAAGLRQRGRRISDAGLELRVVDADLRILGRQLRLERAAQRLARTARIAVDEEAHHVREVVLGAGQPVLQRQEIGAHVLRRARNEAQDLRQAAQHLHLLDAGRRGLAFLRLRLQALEQRHRAAGLPLAVHVEAADSREARDITGGHADQHGVAGLAARFERRQDRQILLLHEQHGADDQIGAADVLDRARQRLRVRTPFGCRVHGQAEARHFARKLHGRALGRCREMVVHRHDDDAHRGTLSGCSGLWHRRAPQG